MSVKQLENSWLALAKLANSWLVFFNVGKQLSNLLDGGEESATGGETYLTQQNHRETITFTLGSIRNQSLLLAYK